MGTFVSGYNGENYPSSTAPNDNVLVNFFFVKIAMVITDTLDEREIEKVTVFENHKKASLNIASVLSQTMLPDKSIFKKTKIGEKCQNWKIQMRHFWVIFKHHEEG